VSAQRGRYLAITPQGQRAIGQPVTVDLRPSLADVDVVLEAAGDSLERATARLHGTLWRDEEDARELREYVETLAPALGRLRVHVLARRPI
jgi:hypothetical protein